jgi:hypothetical protein
LRRRTAAEYGRYDHGAALRRLGKACGKGQHLTADEVALIKESYKARRKIRDVARDLKFLTRGVEILRAA